MLDQAPFLQLTFIIYEYITQHELNLVTGAYQERIGPMGALVGAGIGAAFHQGTHLFNHGTFAPLNTTVAAASIGAVTGFTGGALSAAAGGGIIGNIAWKPGIAAVGYGANKASEFYLNKH